MQHKFTPTTHLKSAALTLLALILACATAWAETETVSSDNFSVNADGTEYTIHNATGWGEFCAALLDNATYNHFSGKTVKLDANISITQSAGSAGHEFMGTFDGDGKTLTVDITETTTQGTAPFREIKGATIQNLVVTGSVVGTIHAAGLVGFARGADASTVNTITNCKVATNVTVTTPSGNNYHCGGVVGHAFHCTLNMSNTVYCGDITNSGNYVGGLQGWSDGNTINFSHCLFVGSYSGTASFHPVAVRNRDNATTANVSHVYYTVTPTLTNSSFIAADGTKTISRATAPATIGDQTQSLNFMSTTIYQNGICYNDLYYATIGLPSGGTDIYLIDNADDWLYFCEMLNDNDTWNRFSGKTVKLGADISVSRMAGNVNHDFCGTFDGQNNTLTFTATATDNYCAPFRYVQGNSNTDHAVIQNLNVVSNITAADYRHPAGLIALQSGYVDVTDCNAVVNINCTKGTNNPHDLYPTGLVSQSNNTGSLTVSGCTVSGTISTDGKYAAGMVGIVQSSASITNSVSSVTINSSTSGDGTHSGFVASLVSDRQLTIEGCVFNGKIVTTNGTTNCGGFLGHNNTNGGTGATITNCLYAPAADPNTVSTGCATFGRNVNSDLINNCYYTTALGDAQDAQGTQTYSISGGNYVTVGNAGTASSSYAVSGLDFYSVGLKYGDVLYAAENDEVSLTLGNTVPEGYFLGYSASPTEATLSGSGNPYTLTMPDADVVITANTNFPSVSYIDENGETQHCTDYIWLTGTETTLGAAGQETYCVVHSTLNYSQSIQLLGNTHIILCDGAAMNIGSSESPVSGSSYQEQVGFYGSGNNLSLYAQSGNTGALTIYSQSCSFDVKDLTIAGGNVNATKISNNYLVIGCTNNLTVCRSSLEIHANGQAVQAFNDVTLSNVTANIISPNGSGLVCSNFAVDNSQLTVTARYQAIQANVITLGCTAATDFIKATTTSSLTDSYYGTVKIADGQTLYAGTNAYTGTLTDAQRQAIGGQKLTNVAPPTYDYIGLDGTGATHTATVIDADYMPTSLSGWYIVQGTVNYTNTINLAGDTHIILADNAVMNVTVGGNHGIRSTSGNNYSLFVYGQTGQSGELNVTSNSFACFISGGDITIAGGKVTASGGIIGLYAQYTNNNGGNVTIKNATVTATGTSHYGIFAENGGNITIDNSNLTATSTGSYGIYAKEGDITITDCEVEAIGGSGIYAYSGNNSGDVGNVTIQNATVTATASFAAIRSNNGNITIDNSNVTATSTGNHGIYAEYGNITIASGMVTASSTNFGIYTVYGSVTINGGQVTTTGSIGIYTVYGSVTINGGQVMATGNIYGIYAQNSSDNITLGWTNPTDFIYANKYYDGGTLSIAEGKAFIDEAGQTYSSAIAQVSGAYAIDGKTLYPNCVVRKQVAGYGEGNGGWVFIASPVAESIAPSEVHNLFPTAGETSNEYDLYRFNQSDDNENEWQNWKATTTENHPDFTTLVNGHGYLYATKETRTLMFAGEYTAATEPVEVPLDYDATAQLKGWNLVGNPFTTQATMTNGNGQPVSFYVINGQNVVPNEGSAAIEPCTGVMVKAEGTGEKVRFTSVSPDQAPQPNKGSLQIALSQVTSSLRGTKQSSTLDNAIISFNEGSKLGKFYFGTQNANIYIPQGNEEYAIAYSNGQGEMPLNFKAKENGTYTISVNPEGVEMDYLHLIDNMTGADIDLLAANGGDAINRVSTYTFEAKTTDYESRFRLVFAADEAVCGPSEAFAFIDASGNIIVNGEGTLQVFDVLGHQLVTKQLSTLNSQLSTLNYKSGVYVLRLINGDDVKTQKMVIE